MYSWGRHFLFCFHISFWRVHRSIKSQIYNKQNNIYSHVCTFNEMKPYTHTLSWEKNIWMGNFLNCPFSNLTVWFCLFCCFSLRNLTCTASRTLHVETLSQRYAFAAKQRGSLLPDRPSVLVKPSSLSCICICRCQGQALVNNMFVRPNIHTCVINVNAVSTVCSE